MDDRGPAGAEAVRPGRTASFVRYAELAEAVPVSTSIRTRKLMRNWIGTC